jgi:hypothetical protein
LESLDDGARNLALDSGELLGKGASEISTSTAKAKDDLMLAQALSNSGQNVYQAENRVQEFLPIERGTTSVVPSAIATLSSVYSMMSL